MTSIPHLGNLPTAMLSESTLSRLAARQNEVSANSARLYQTIAKDFPESRVEELQAAVAAIVSDNVPLPEKIRRLQLLASDMLRPIQPHIPCRAGCSACCQFLRVPISQTEAEMIGEFIGRAPATLPAGSPTAPAKPSGKFGIPCPFLKENRCSVYEVRPVACRTHIVLDIDNLLCGYENAVLAEQLDPRAVGIPRLNASVVTNAYWQIHREQQQASADIRQFFPLPDDDRAPVTNTPAD